MSQIKVIKLEEAGRESALIGLSLNRRVEGALDYYYDIFLEKEYIFNEVAGRLCNKDHGHNKFLEHIDTWWLIRASRNFWQEADTYRLTTKQSGSTMHTLYKRKLTNEDFNTSIPESYIEYLNELVQKYIVSSTSENLEELKDSLPEGYLQTREWKLNYKNLREILLQRSNHRLPSWKIFCAEIKKQVIFPEWLP
jgi:hypothetical protein